MIKYTLEYGFAVALLFSSPKDALSNELIVINDINNALTKENISKITPIIEKEVLFHKSHMEIPKPLYSTNTHF